MQRRTLDGGTEFTFYRSPKANAHLEDMRVLLGGYGNMIKKHKTDITGLNAPPWLKELWRLEQNEIENPMFNLGKDGYGVFLCNIDSGFEDYLTFMERLRFRFSGAVPVRFYNRHEADVRRKYRIRAKELIAEMKDARLAVPKTG